jgi:hypothetical protein
MPRTNTDEVHQAFYPCASVSIRGVFVFRTGYTLNMIQIPLTPDQFAVAAKLLQEKQGITLTGDEGTIVKMGVTASYKYADGLLSIAILEKPFFVTTEYCEQQIKSFFTHTG